jgi:hypothetical protein
VTGADNQPSVNPPPNADSGTPEKKRAEQRHPWLRAYHEALSGGDPPSVAIAKANATPIDGSER